MDETASLRARRRLVGWGLLAAHAEAYAWAGWIKLPAMLTELAGGQLSWSSFLEQTFQSNTHEFLNVLLLAANVVLAALVARGGVELLLGGGAMFLIGAHSFLGQRLAPDALTSGALLLVNLLVFYTGAKLMRHLPARFLYAFIAGYFVLFFTFIQIKWQFLLPFVKRPSGMANAEALFLLFALGLCACARSWRLLTYFWCVTLSFTFAQPYAWEAALISCFITAALFGARGFAKRPAGLIMLGVGLVLVFLVLLPVVIVILGEDLHNYTTFLGDERIRAAIGRTALTATYSTLFLIVLAVPLAYGMSRLRFPGRTLLLSLIDLPIVVPQSVAGIALIKVFGANQPIGEGLHRLFGISFDSTLWGVCLAQVFVAMPFIVKASMAAFDAVPPELEQSARALGASGWGAFGRVALPLAARGIFLGAVLAWARAAGEFGALVFIAQTPVTAPVEAWNRFNGPGGIAEAGPLVALLLAFSLAMFFLLQLTVRLLPRAPTGRGEALP